MHRKAASHSGTELQGGPGPENVSSGGSGEAGAGGTRGVRDLTPTMGAFLGIADLPWAPLRMADGGHCPGVLVHEGSEALLGRGSAAEGRGPFCHHDPLWQCAQRWVRLAGWGTLSPCPRRGN